MGPGMGPYISRVARAPRRQLISDHAMRLGFAHHGARDGSMLVTRLSAFRCIYIYMKGPLHRGPYFYD